MFVSALGEHQRGTRPTLFAAYGLVVESSAAAAAETALAAGSTYKDAWQSRSHPYFCVRLPAYLCTARWAARPRCSGRRMLCLRAARFLTQFCAGCHCAAAGTPSGRWCQNIRSSKRVLISVLCLVLRGKPAACNEEPTVASMVELVAPMHGFISKTCFCTSASYRPRTGGRAATS